MATLLSLAGYLLYIVFMTALSYLAYKAVSFPLMPQEHAIFVLSISIFLPLVFKKFMWLALTSEFPFSFPSGVSGMLATLVTVTGYFVFMTVLSFLMLVIAIVVCEAASHPVPDKEMPPDWMVMIGLGASIVVVDVFINHSSHSTMITMLFFLAGYLVYVMCMMGIPYLVFRGAMYAFSVKEDTGEEFFLVWVAIFLPLTLKNFPWLTLISDITLPSGVSEMVATLVGIVGYLVCMNGLSLLVLYIAYSVCEAVHPVPKEEKNSPDWMVMICLGSNVVVMDLFINHSSHSTMIAMLFFLAGYLVYVMCMMGIPYLVFRGAMYAFSVNEDTGEELFLIWIAIFSPLTLKNFSWLTFISDITLPSGVSEMVATLVGTACYLVCMNGLSLLVLYIAYSVCEAAHPVPKEEKKSPDWMVMICLGSNVVVMDLFINHSSHTTMIAMLFFLAGYLVYVLCMMGIPYLVFRGAMYAFSVKEDTGEELFLIWIAIFFPLTLKNFPWLTLLSNMGLPSGVSEMVATLVGIAGYLVCMNGLSLLVLCIAYFVCEAAHPVPKEEKNSPDWMVMTCLGANVVVMDLFINHSGHSNMKAIIFFLAGYLVYNAWMVALSFVVLIIAAAAIVPTMNHIQRPELMLTTVMGLTFMLLNMMWGRPFEKPSCDSSMKASLVGLAGYAIYIMCAMALSGLSSKSMADTFVISLTFVLLDMFSVSDIIAALVGLFWVVAISVMALFFLVTLSFVVSMGLHMWVAMLLPSALKNYRELTFASIVGISFKVMKIMLDLPAVEKISILCSMKAALIGIADLRNEYYVAYLVIRYLTVLALPFLFMESKYKTSTNKFHTMAAVIITLGLVLTMPPSPPMPVKDLALQAMILDDIIQRTVMSFVTHTILIMITFIGGTVLYVRDQYPLWKLTIGARYREFKKDAGQEAKSYVDHLVYKCTLGCFGKKKVNASRRRADHRR